MEDATRMAELARRHALGIAWSADERAEIAEHLRAAPRRAECVRQLQLERGRLVCLVARLVRDAGGRAGRLTDDHNGLLVWVETNAGRLVFPMSGDDPREPWKGLPVDPTFAVDKHDQVELWNRVHRQTVDLAEFTDVLLFSAAGLQLLRHATTMPAHGRRDLLVLSWCFQLIGEGLGGPPAMRAADLCALDGAADIGRPAAPCGRVECFLCNDVAGGPGRGEWSAREVLTPLLVALRNRRGR